MVLGGCTTTDGPQKMYSGPDREPGEVAVVISDDYLFVGERGTRSAAFLPGRTTLELDYFRNMGASMGYIESIVSIHLETTLEAGRRYQLIGREREHQETEIEAAIVDITTQDDIWSFYQDCETERHLLRAVDYLTDKRKLNKVAQTNPWPLVRIAAIRKINTTADLEKVLSLETDASVRIIVEERIDALAKKKH